jgi:hypothetical protein
MAGKSFPATLVRRLNGGTYQLKNARLLALENDYSCTLAVLELPENPSYQSSGTFSASPK